MASILKNKFSSILLKLYMDNQYAHVLFTYFRENTDIYCLHISEKTQRFTVYILLRMMVKWIQTFQASIARNQSPSLDLQSQLWQRKMCLLNLTRPLLLSPCKYCCSDTVVRFVTARQHRHGNPGSKPDYACIIVQHFYSSCRFENCLYCKTVSPWYFSSCN